MEKTYLGAGAATGSEDLIARLGRGFQTFKADHYNKETALFNKLKTGQWPKYMVIAYPDSWVDPATILELQLREAFMVRNVANNVVQASRGNSPHVHNETEATFGLARGVMS